jgi:hypothetical protein
MSSGIQQTVESSVHLEILSHVFRKGTKSDTRKVIDRKLRVFGLSNVNMSIQSALISGSVK